MSLTQESPHNDAEPAAEPPDVLRAEGVKLRIGGLQILDGIDFAIGRGEICGVVGPNGSGKSTFLNVISGFMKPDEAKLTFNGHDITRQPAWVRARMGIGRSFQRVRLLEAETAHENVRAGLIHRGSGAKSRDDRVPASLKRVSADEFEDWPLRYLSYGTRRKVELARVVASEPKLLLVDEPTAGVSRAHIGSIEQLLREEAERGCAIIIVDHDLEFIRRMAPRVVVFDYGQEIFQGTPEATFSNPRVVEAYIGK